MKETPIIFRLEIVKAIREGRCTMTRRTRGLEKVNQEPDAWSVIEQPVHWSFYKHNEPDGDGHFVPLNIKCPYGQVGDRLWVRETWATSFAWEGTKPSDMPPSTKIYYFPKDSLDPPDIPLSRWRSSIFMPRWASRLTLEITEIRVERVQEIKEEDAEAEGVTTGYALNNPNRSIDLRNAYQYLWDSLNAKRGYGWDKNPWVWPIKFDNIGVRIK